MMAGLRCGDVSPLAFNHLQPVVDAYVSIDDQWAARAMRQLARPAGRDPVIRAGASGAAALGGLMACLQSPAHADTREALQLSAAPTAMAIVSEGVTDDSLWAEVMRQA
jgi:threonine dehydratase